LNLYPNIYTLHATMRAPQETHGITSISHQIHVSCLIHHLYLKHPILMQGLNHTTQNPCATYANIQISVHMNQTTIPIYILHGLKRQLKPIM